MPIKRPCPFHRRLLRRLGLIAVVSLYAAVPATAAPALKVALLPIVDSLPFYVAQQEGYFQAAGVDVEAVKVASAVARDQLMQTGQVDGMLNEIISAANFNRVKPQVQVVSVVRRARPGHPLFRLLAAPGRQTPAIASLAGVAVGISRHTVIEYVTDRLLANAGLDPQLVRKQSVPSIPERYQLLIQGQLAAATLPDPLAMSAVQAGAILVADDTRVADYSLSILTFAVTAIESRPQKIHAFIDSWHRAAAKINTDPQSQRALMLEKIRIPPNVRTRFRIPPFARHEVPTEDQWQDAMHWMQSRRLLDAPLPYRESVTDRFIAPYAGEKP